MRLHPRNKPVQGDPFVPNRFIFGDAVDGEALEPYEYVVHTGIPAFVCRLVGNDDTPFIGRDESGFVSAVLYDEDENVTHYVCNTGYRLFDFNFWEEEIPTAAVLQGICDEAMRTYQRLSIAYQHNEQHPPEREMMVVPSEPLPPAKRAKRVQELAEQAQEAVNNPLKRVKLNALVRAALLGGDQSVFTEAQLSLLMQSEARNLLVECAQDAIALPEVVRKDGSIVSYELWALPLVFAREQGGVWWHFPSLERMESVLADALQLPEEVVLWLSPTLFTFEMLQERACQPLIYLAQVMDSGRDLAPYEPESARATFEAANQTKEQQLVLCWIPFLLERGALTTEKAQRLASKALEAVMPIVQESLAEKMPYVEAELFAPLPWWQALGTAVGAFNRRRLGLTLALLSAHGHEPKTLRAVIEYQPDHLAYDIGLHGDEPRLAHTPWLLVPDMAPDRERALSDLLDCLRESGVTAFEQSSRLLH